MLKEPSLRQAVTPLISMFLLISLGSLILKLPLTFLLIISAVITGAVAKSNGLSWNDMLEGIGEKVSQAFPAILILLCIGALIASWMLSGTIPMLLYYGIKTINPHYLYVTGFLVTAMFSTLTGTSFGSAGTVGVAVMGVAISQGLSLPIAAGAVISGAIFGDKLSPCSDTTVLASLSTRTKLYEHIQHMVYTTGAATILSLIVYIMAGILLPVSQPLQVTESLLKDLEMLYHFNWLLLLPPVIIVSGAYLKKPTIIVMLISTFAALLIGIIMHDFSIQTASNTFVNGFNLALITPTQQVENLALLKKLFNRGGMMSMMNVILLVFCVFSFAGIYSKAGFLKVLLKTMTQGISSVGVLITTTVIASVLVCCITGSTYVAILMLGELFGPLYAEMNLHSKNLSRTLEDAGTCVVPIIPWSITGSYLSYTVGVPTLEYLPWAVLCYSGMLFAVIFGFTGYAIAKITPEEAAECVSE
ncbi:MAG: Na+/H+ antiporter NhaC [Acholeplasmataceae bacterium]|nr:Na+/H+ antiporter NhaC [Acholeplasmataceae bacterium]